MNVSTFTRWDRAKFIALFAFLTVMLASTRRFPFILFAAAPAAVVAILVMRTRILRHFAKTPIRQVAYVSLTEPVYHYYTANVGEDENGRPIMERRRETVGRKRREIPLVQRIDPCYVDFLKYLEEKRNPSVLITGQPSMGKTELMKILLLSQTIPKIIFSFKANDTYVELPYPTVDVSKHTPNPFQDPDAFSIAYELAFPANVMGIMLSQARTMVKNLARESRNWGEFRQNLKRTQRKATDIQTEALALIEGQIESLAIGEGTFEIDLSKDTILDFSGLEESAKTFYAEIALRQIWKLLTTGGRTLDGWEGMRIGQTVSRSPQPSERQEHRLIIAIDEVNRLSQLYEELGTKSVIDVMMRQVRRYGKLYTATHNYSDIPDKQRNLYGTRLTFNTSSEKDLAAIHAIDPAYDFVVKELPPYRFVDLTLRVGEGMLFPIFKADLTPPRAGVAGKEGPATTNPNLTHPAQNTAFVDYDAMIRDKLDNIEVVWVSGLAALVQEKYHVDKDAAKLKVRDALLKLLSAGEVQVQKYDDAESGETTSLYFAKSLDEKLSALHRYMTDKLIGKLREDREKILNVAESGQNLPDVETEGAYYEIESGLKTRTSDLEERIAKLSAIKPFIILVPNTDIAKSERYTRLSSSRLVVATLADFLSGEVEIPH